jgi:hypothetical protein
VPRDFGRSPVVYCSLQIWGRTGYRIFKRPKQKTPLKSSTFEPDTPLGISIHYDRARTADGHRWQTQSAQLLRDSLQKKDFNNILPAQGWWSYQDDWLEKITTATEATAQTYHAEPEQVGHIAVVCALDAQRHMNTRPAFTYGEAFLMTNVSHTASFAWQKFDIPGPPGPDTTAC